MAAILFLGIGNVLAQNSPATSPALPPGESEKIDAYLQAYHSGVIVTKTTTDSSGQTVSCVDIQHQPALNNPALKGHKIQMQPSPQLLAMLGAPVKEDTTPTACPKGSVEMRLPTREQIVRAGSLQKFMSKYPGGSSGIPSINSNVPAAPSTIPHEYAVYGQTVNAVAAQTTINVWDSFIANPTLVEFSLTQLWMVGGTGSGLQTVEVGSQVFPAKYGDNAPHLFIYYTTDNYSNSGTLASGCYNLECSGFVHLTNILPIGGTLPSSTLGGAQVEGTVAFIRDPGTGHWWLYYFDGTTYTYSGYYPKSLFGSGQMSQYAQWIEFGGEILPAQTSPHTAANMGSGQFPSAGTGYAAYQRNVQYMDTTSTITHFPFSPGWPVVTNANCYNIAWGTNPAWGSSLYFGGPGHSSICP
jgi:hypothetical protein